MKSPNHAYIYDAVRTPRAKGKSDGQLHTIRPIDLTRTVLRAIQERNHLDTQYVDDVILGCVTPVMEQGGCIAKAAAVYAGYHEAVAGVTLNRFCASGLEAVNQAAAGVMSGFQELIVAGGIESMSRVPMGSDGGAWLIDPDVIFKTQFVPQGISADLIATLKGYSRSDVDQYAVRSQRLAGIAQKSGFFEKSIVPVRDHLQKEIANRDSFPRPETTVESLSALKPSFKDLGEKMGFASMTKLKYPSIESINYVHHAGNSSGIVDGASAVLIGSDEIGKKLGLKPRARIKSMAITSTDPTIMLTGPAPATRKALVKAGMAISDIDLIEINEAFASVVLNFIDEMKLDIDKVNVNGGAIALGHPLGATGAMLVGTVLDELERRNLGVGLVTLCVGGGMGIATIIERV
jgi:acetyl-CoA C-acetyltransferase